VGLLVVAVVTAFVFNAVTTQHGKPVRSLWHGRFVDAGGVLTAYRSWGTTGTPVICLGGFLEPSFVWAGVGPRLAASGHRVYALDLDGFGYTKRTGPWTLEGWAHQVRGFLQALGIHDPIVVGHSLGAAVAVELAREHVASRAILADGDAVSAGGPPASLRTLLVESPFVTTAMRLATMWDWPVKQVIANAYGPHHPPIGHSDVVRWTRPLEAEGAQHALEEMSKNGIPGFSRDELAQLAVKATVIWGAADNVDALAQGQLTARALHARFVVIPKVGHLSMLAAPAAVARAIARATG